MLISPLESNDDDPLAFRLARPWSFAALARETFELM